MLTVLSLTVSPSLYLVALYLDTKLGPVSLVCGRFCCLRKPTPGLCRCWVLPCREPLNRQPVNVFAERDVAVAVTVDIFVPTYNEDLTVKNTIYASRLALTG